ncbi:MAG: ABC transporter [Clostridiales bacterium]|jgi:ABC-2 type transport system permease protein|nr:ABC transporter [Clostridiales bacterium]
MGAIFRREIGAYFNSSIAYVFLAVFFVYSGFSFWATSLLASTADMTGVFTVVFLALIFLIPILTMRLFSEEKKQKTEQCLLTAPISLGAMVCGKYFAALALYTIGISIFFVYALILSYFGAVAWGMVLSNFLALFLVGAAFVSVGTFISALTENQVVAAVTGVITLMLLWLFDSAATLVNIEFIAKLLMSLSFYSRYAEFTSGLFNLSSVLFYVSTVVIFLFLTVRVYEKRRWS